jgi:formylglycine-generating enzyme
MMKILIQVMLVMMLFLGKAQAAITIIHSGTSVFDAGNTAAGSGTTLTDDIDISLSSVADLLPGTYIRIDPPAGLKWDSVGTITAQGVDLYDSSIIPVGTGGTATNYLKIPVSGANNAYSSININTDTDTTLISTSPMTNIEAGALTITFNVGGTVSSATFGDVDIVSSISFTATPITGWAPLTVTLNGTTYGDSDGTISNYSWSSSDGQSATGATAAMLFNNAGSYTITLTVTDSNGLVSSRSQTVTAEANQPPTASFTATPTTGSIPVPLTIVLDGTTSSDSDGRIASYYWSSSDGQSATEASSTLLFNSAGTYTITLTVTDNNGLTNSSSQTVMVEAPNVDVNASFTATPTSGDNPLTVTLDATASSNSDGSISSYVWESSDGTSSTGATTSFTYSNPGSYAIMLTVTDNEGLTHQTTQTITVSPSTSCSDYTTIVSRQSRYRPSTLTTLREELLRGQYETIASHRQRIRDWNAEDHTYCITMREAQSYDPESGILFSVLNTYGLHPWPLHYEIGIESNGTGSNVQQFVSDMYAIAPVSVALGTLETELIFSVDPNQTAIYPSEPYTLARKIALEGDMSSSNITSWMRQRWYETDSEWETRLASFSERLVVTINTNPSEDYDANSQTLTVTVDFSPFGLGTEQYRLSNMSPNDVIRFSTLGWAVATATIRSSDHTLQLGETEIYFGGTLLTVVEDVLEASNNTISLTSNQASSQTIISGGIAPFSVTVNDPTIITASITANQLTARALRNGTTTMTVTDTTGLSVTISITASNIIIDTVDPTATLQAVDVGDASITVEVSDNIAADFDATTISLVRVNSASVGFSIAAGSSPSRPIIQLSSTIFTGGETYEVTVTVEDLAGNSQTYVLSGTVAIPLSTQETLALSGYAPLTGTITILTGTATEYSSSDTSIATVDQAGTVTAITSGIVTVTATDEAGSSDTTTITIELLEITPLNYDTRARVSPQVIAGGVSPSIIDINDTQFDIVAMIRPGVLPIDRVTFQSTNGQLSMAMSPAGVLSNGDQLYKNTLTFQRGAFGNMIMHTAWGNDEGQYNIVAYDTAQQRSHQFPDLMFGNYPEQSVDLQHEQEPSYNDTSRLSPQIILGGYSPAKVDMNDTSFDVIAIVREGTLPINTVSVTQNQSVFQMAMTHAGTLTNGDHLYKMSFTFERNSFGEATLATLWGNEPGQFNITVTDTAQQESHDFPDIIFGDKEAALAGGAISNSLGMNFRIIPAGSFTMGSPTSEEGRYDRESQHQVTISQPFYLQTTEVTNAQYRRYRSSHNSGDYSGHDLDGDSQPVVEVSWHDANNFAQWLSAEEGVNYRLPTEAELEYATRAGTTSARWWGEDADQACGNANVRDQAASAVGLSSSIHNCNDGYVVTAPVASFQPNPWGLYDTLGNVWEWSCSEDGSSYSGAESACNNDANDNASRVMRGGSWNFMPRLVRSANRHGGWPGSPDSYIGFRLARSL